MQQVTAHQEERYADGLDEYASFYGGPSYHYLAAPKPPSSPRGSTASQPSTLDPNRHSATSNLQHAISYDLAANVPEFRRDAEGLQLAYQSPITGAPAPYHLTAQGYTREAEGLQINQQRPLYHYQTNVAQPNMFTPRNSSLNSGHPVPAAAPTPLSFRRRSSVTEPNLYQFPQPPTSPTSPASPTSPTTLKLLHPLAQKPIPQQPLPQVPAAPQPLKFQRSNTAPMPPTPPRSVGGRSNEDALRDQMLGLKLGDPSPILGKYASGPPRFPLGRMDTVSSMSSARSSNTPGSPFDQQHRISVAQGNPTPSLPDVIELGPPAMSATDAQAEVLRLLDKADETSSKKSGATVKKGFSLKRSNTTKPASNASHSQDALTSVLENVAEEGSLPMVKAVIGLGADPVYRSSGKLKKVKHEALSKATATGRADVVDFLLHKGASYGEASKKGTFTPLDRALLTAVYSGHAELARVLIMNHGANPMVEQWPREMDDTQHYWAQNQVRLSKTSVLDGLLHWKNEEQGMHVLRAAMTSSKFDPTASASGVFDNKSELQSGEFANRPWNTTYEYSAVACFARAGWADAVEELLGKKGSPKDYEKEDEVLQYQDKVTRWISPINALTKDTWEQRPESALRILRVLIDRGFNLSLPQRTANDLGQRTALGRALSANASQAVELITQARPELVKEVISFRRNKKETKAQPLAAAICLERLDTARVLFRMGAHPRDPAFDMNALQFCAHQGGETGSVMLAEMIGLAPELTYAALDVAVRRINADCVRVLLDSISAAAARNEVAALPAIWDMLLPIPTSTIEESTASKSSYLALIDMVFTWDAGRALPAPQLPAILAAIKRDNYVGMEKFLKLGIVDGKSLVLNCKAQPMGEQGLWTVLECAEGTQRSSEWLGLLRGWGAPLYT